LRQVPDPEGAGKWGVDTSVGPHRVRSGNSAVGADGAVASCPVHAPRRAGMSAVIDAAKHSAGQIDPMRVTVPVHEDSGRRDAPELYQPCRI
jgi:hypothetical protein